MKYRSSKQAIAKQPSLAVKQIVGDRDGWRCIVCRRPGDPVAHYIPRTKGGLGIPENILTLCNECHKDYDNSRGAEREEKMEFFSDYLKSQYPDWDETKLIYHKWRTEE